MRTNNGGAKTTLVSTYFIIVILTILLGIVFRVFNNLTSSWVFTFILIFLAFVVLFMVIHFSCKFFEYDSDGSKVVLINKGLLLSDRYDFREHIVEFDKGKLIGFKFKNYLVYKSLNVVYVDVFGITRRDVFNVSLVRHKKIRYIKQSLSKTVKSNLKKRQKND
jgi:hypothetical protein